MCITFFKINGTRAQNSLKSGQRNLKFMIGFNRDEDADRIATPMSFHNKYPNIVCGVDKLTGTTWLALNKLCGDFAFLTNYRSMANIKVEGQTYKTRGNLILEYVKIRDKTISDEDKMYTSIEEY